MRLRHALLVALSLHLSTTTLDAQSTLRAAPSGRASSEVTLEYPRDAAPAGSPRSVSIRLEYGQPHLRGRAINSDSLVPFGQPWRTGANNATTLTTGVDLVIGGKPVPQGTYVVWTLPTRTGWTLILQKSAAPAGTQQTTPYDAANDVARIALRQQTLATPIESLTMWLIPARDASPARGELRMAWGTTQLSADWVVR
jgi:hypothetical protein